MCCRIQHHLGNECSATAGSGLNRVYRRLTVTDHLIEISCATRDLGDGPVADRRAQCRHIHLVDEVAEVPENNLVEGPPARLTRDSMLT